jgi:putative endonuclease
MMPLSIGDGFLQSPERSEGSLRRDEFKVVNVNRKIPLRRFQRCYFVYIVASLRGTLYVGLTDDLQKRIRQHKEGTFDGFTKKYKVNRLMYFETYTDSKFAEHREIQVKKYRREKKISLFRDSNPEWKDLFPEIFQSIGIPRYARDFRKQSHTTNSAPEC